MHTIERSNDGCCCDGWFLFCYGCLFCCSFLSFSPRLTPSSSNDFSTLTSSSLFSSLSLSHFIISSLSFSLSLPFFVFSRIFSFNFLPHSFRAFSLLLLMILMFVSVVLFLNTIFSTWTPDRWRPCGDLPSSCQQIQSQPASWSWASPTRRQK